MMDSIALHLIVMMTVDLVLINMQLQVLLFMYIYHFVYFHTYKMLHSYAHIYTYMISSYYCLDGIIFK
jgi:hypothetical protein